MDSTEGCESAERMTAVSAPCRERELRVIAVSRMLGHDACERTEAI